MTEKEEESADSCDEETTKLDDISEIVNKTMGAALVLASESKKDRAETKISLEEFSETLKDFGDRVENIEKLRQTQLLASTKELEKISNLEREGIELAGSNLIASLLGTLSLVYEIMGKMEVQVSRIENRLNVTEQKNVENLMEMRVIREQQTNIISELGDLKQESVKLRQQDKKTNLRIIYIFTIIFIILAGIVGISTFFNALRGGV